MRILQINSVYTVGSTGKIVGCIARGLVQQGHEVRILYGIGAKHYDDISQKVCGKWEHLANAVIARTDGIPFGGIYLSNHKIEREIEAFKPDVVHVHCVNSFILNIYSLLKFLATRNIKTIVTLHAEFFHTGSCGHAYDCDKWKTHCHNCATYKRECASWFFDRSYAAWKKMNKAFSYFKEENIHITAVSPWLADRAKASAILGRFDISYVPNGLDPEVFHYRDSEGLIDRGKYKKVVLFVAPYFNLNENDLKGGRYLPEIARRLPDYKFLVVASSIPNNLPALPENIQVWGRAKSQLELAQLYSEADLTLLLSKRETFSMVTAESLCCGTPVVGFLAGGPESIAIPEYCRFVEYGNLEHLIDSFETEFPNTGKELSLKAISLYAKDNMIVQYQKIYCGLLS